MLIRRRQAGVTLVELIIGIAILSIVLALGVPSYNVWIQNTRLRSTAESILNGLQLARAEAVSRNATVRFVLNGRAWSVCLLSGTDAGCTGTILQTKAAEEGSSSAVTVQVSNNISDIDFNPLGRGTTVTIDVDVSTTVLPAAESRNLRVVVRGGNVLMCDPNVASPDSRACPA